MDREDPQRVMRAICEAADHFEQIRGWNLPSYLLILQIRPGTKQLLIGAYESLPLPDYVDIDRFLTTVAQVVLTDGHRYRKFFGELEGIYGIGLIEEGVLVELPDETVSIAPVCGEQSAEARLFRAIDVYGATYAVTHRRSGVAIPVTPDDEDTAPRHFDPLRRLLISIVDSQDTTEESTEIIQRLRNLPIAKEA